MPDNLKPHANHLNENDVFMGPESYIQGLTSMPTAAIEYKYTDNAECKYVLPLEIV